MRCQCNLPYSKIRFLSLTLYTVFIRALPSFFVDDMIVKLSTKHAIFTTGPIKIKENNNLILVVKT